MNRHHPLPEVSRILLPAAPGVLPEVCTRVSFESVLALFPSTTTELPFT
ncbi:MAG: hypothetical protein IPM27_00435 [Nitrosomonadales bacterium]|nr:hypothetical protein [Nitrosomonadales bacterium]